MTQRKKYLIYVLGFILALLTIVTCVLFSASYNRIDFSIKSISGENYISSIKVGETHYKVKDFASKYDLDTTNDENELILKENQNLSFELTVFHNIDVYFNKDKSTGKVKVTYDDNEKIIDLSASKSTNQFYYYTSLTNIFLTQLSSFSIVIYMLIIISAIVLTILYSFLIFKITNIFIKCKKNNNIKIRDIIFLFLVYSIVNIFCALPLIEILNNFYFLIIVFQLIGIVIYFKNNLKASLTSIFLFFSIILTVNMAIILPPFHVPDELAHYFKAYSIFNSNDIIVKKDKAFIEMPKSVENTIDKYSYDFHSSEFKISAKEYFADFSVIASQGEKVKYGFTNTYSISPFAYLPSAIIIKICMLLELPFIFSTVLGRLINALFFVVLGYLALKIIPKFKNLLFLVMLFPITIQQVAAVNQDSLTLTLVFIILAILIKEIYSNSKMTNKTMYTIFILSAFLGLMKPTYFLITLLTFLIPKNRYTSKKQCYMIRFLPFIICLVFSSVFLVTTTKKATDMTIGYVITHPLFLIRIVLNTFYVRGLQDLLTGQLNIFGWSTVYYDYIFSTLIYTAYFFAIFFDNEEKGLLKVSHRLLYLFIAILLVGLIYASALFGFGGTDKFSYMIGGLQSRYFIPVTFILAIAVSNSIVKYNLKNKTLFLTLLVIFTYAVSFYTILNGFYL